MNEINAIKNITDYIVEQALILIPVLCVLGEMLKNTPKIPNWLIPWILTVIGIIGGCAIIGINASGIIQGILIAGVTVLGNQLVKQTIKRD